MFTDLPTEIQLSVLSQSDSQSTRQISQEWYQLSQYITNKKLQHYLSDSLYISLFCVNAKQQNRKLFYELVPTQTGSTIEFTLSELIKSESLLPLLTKPKSFQAETSSESHLDLSINEEQSSIKVYVQLYHNDQLLNETSIRLSTSQLSQDLVKVSNDLKFEIRSVKESLVETEEGYQYEDVWNYSLDFQKVSIQNSTLVDMIEKENDNMIIRC